MSIRAFQLPTDLDLMGTLIRNGFQYPENPSWNAQEDEEQNRSELLKGAKKIWPLIRFAQMLNPPLRDLFNGFIYEENGEPAGLINFMRRSGAPEWTIVNVTVLPEFRRRGIARKLVMKTLEEVKKRKARVALLQVLKGNTPAHNLYKDMGFEDYASETEFEFHPDQTVDIQPIPDGFHAVPIRRFNQTMQFEFTKHITPGIVGRYEQITEERFNMPPTVMMFGRFLEKAEGVRVQRYIMQTGSNETVGLVSTKNRIRQGGYNSLNIQLDPAYPQLTVPALSHFISAVKSASPGRRTKFSIKDWQPELVKAANSLECKQKTGLISMGLLI